MSLDKDSHLTQGSADDFLALLLNKPAHSSVSQIRLKLISVFVIEEFCGMVAEVFSSKEGD